MIKKIYVVALFFGLLLNNTIFSQHQVVCKYLIDPELNIGYVDSCASFWLKSYDETLGGFYTNVDRQGNVITAWGTNKNMLTQSRTAYGMVRAYMLTGNEGYLSKAKAALDFMYNSAWDNVNGGWFGEVDKNGSPINPTENKTAFNQHYALLGILAYYEATGDTTAFNWFTKGFTKNQEDLWDSDDSLFGYYDYSNFNWSSKNGKSFNATVDAVTTHLINAFLLTGENTYKNKLIEIADNIINRLASTVDDYQIGFVENFGTDWSWNDNTANNNTRTIMGHVLKAGWVLGRIYEVIPNDIYLQNAEKLVLNVWEKGYDHNSGGPYKDYDRVTGEMFFYGQDTAKAWWQVEQAIVAGLELYHLTKNDIYLEMSDQSLNFFMKYFVDHTYGEIYADLFSNGTTIPAWGTAKGNGSKAGYHSIETGYYAYLYGNLFYNDNPIELYYKIEPVDYNREIVLSPLAINSQLSIKEVIWDNEPYPNYISDTRRLIVNAGVGGKIKVIFETDYPISVPASETLAPKFELSQNYPNPFNPSTIIRYTIPEAGNVSLKIYDVLGREVRTLINKELNSGEHEIEFDAGSLSSGIYFYNLKTGNFTSTKKLMLLK